VLRSLVSQAGQLETRRVLVADATKINRSLLFDRSIVKLLQLRSPCVDSVIAECFDPLFHGHLACGKGRTVNGSADVTMTAWIR
jgi:hypothetical protein